MHTPIDFGLKQSLARTRVFLFLFLILWMGSFSICSLPTLVRYLNAYTGVVLLRCRKEFYQLLWSALPFITHLESKGHRYSCFLNTLHVGGTIRTCQKFLIQYNRRQLLMLLQNCTDEGEREAIKKSVSRSCLLEKEPAEELSDIAGEDTVEAIEWPCFQTYLRDQEAVGVGSSTPVLQTSQSTGDPVINGPRGSV